MFIYRACKDMKPIFSQFNAIKNVHTPFKLHLLLLFCLCVEFISVPFHSGFPTIFYLIFMRATCAAHLIFLGSITLVTGFEECVL
jgi:hypothetical protein